MTTPDADIIGRLRIYLGDERHIYKGSHAIRKRSALEDFDRIVARLAELEHPRMDENVVTVTEHRLRTIVEATRTIISTARFCMGLVISDDWIINARIEDARHAINEASDAIHEYRRWPDSQEHLAELEQDRRRLDWLDENDGEVDWFGGDWWEGDNQVGTLRQAIDAAIAASEEEPKP